ncbi:winged helix-turn-helix domain-containing protein [Pleurocapsa sp. PCC 7319]|uniref:helix-turn-helix domain-containing protein n=1 Tax=Pleurocapsa sp. PCC 7319 TaxID=118161 RepID=UPI000349A3B7|nr:helix-turn-helix domain-containing protein [Pleurocapsa sp. PCC 7319]
MSQKHFQTPKDDECQAVGKYLTSFQRKLLQKSLQPELTDKQRQRIQIMLLADEGKTQAQICQELGCCQATARHWITMARTNQAHHWKSNPIGRPTLVHEEYLQRLKQLVTKSPQEVNVPNQDYQYPFKRWTAQKLSQHLHKELGIKVTPQHLNRLLKQMGLSTRPKPVVEAEGDRSSKGIQIDNLDTVSMFDTSEIWNFNPLASN